jgi:1,4-dihydroxy-2-naphthoate octaprenyltransferase
VRDTLSVNDWLAGARPRTLPAAIVPVAVGTAAAVGVAPFVAWRAVAALVVSLALQVGVNYANDYSDGVRGTDAEGARVGPIRLVGSGIRQPSQVKRAAFAAFGVAAVFGLALAVAVGWQLLVVGVAAIAAAWFYTGGPRPYGYAGLGEVFVFVFFGLVATVGSTYVQTEEVTGLSLGASIPVGLLATALLVVNNLRDIPGDTAAGKNTLAVRLGDSRTRIFYTVLLAVSFLVVPPLAAFGRIGAVIALAGIPFAQRPVVAVLGGATGPALIPVLGATGRLQLVVGTLLTIGLWVSA